MKKLTTIVEWNPVCQMCVHHRGRMCDAFPAKIPDDIWQGRDAHRTVRRDQVGDSVLTFASAQDEKDARALGLIR